MTTINITLSNDISNIGIDGTTEQLRSWLAYATEQLEAAYPTATVTEGIEESVSAVNADGEDDDALANEIGDRIQDLFQTWCER